MAEEDEEVVVEGEGGTVMTRKSLPSEAEVGEEVEEGEGEEEGGRLIPLLRGALAASCGATRRQRPRPPHQAAAAAAVEGTWRMCAR